MTAGIQAIDTEPGAARPAGLRATALRRLRRDPVATARTADGQECFGSRTVRVAGSEEYLRRRIARALNALAYPDEQGGALVDQGAAEADLADRVIPIRLGWLREHAAKLGGLIDELEGRWTADGRMADGALQAGDR